MSDQLLRAERLASLGTMAGAIGHELQNVLTPFAGALEFIRRNAAEGRPPEAEDVSMLQQTQEHLLVHAHNLLNLGRPAQPGPNESSDLGHVVSDVLGMLRSAGLLRRAVVRLDVAVEAIVVGIGKVALEQVLINIIKNAVEALDDSRPERPAIQIGIGYSGDATAECTIADNAGGVADGSLPLIFEPYFTTKSPERGTGLGLFVVRQLVRAAGGDVTVQSEQGRGTTFAITVPRAPGGYRNPAIERQLKTGHHAA
jgi:two-component system C4-dicarboxylate transport sensor histidine kinase DctB